MAEYKKLAAFEDCVLELLLNSLRFEATAIAVRIDAHKKRLMVIDNGCGISKNDLLHLGEKRVENKNLKNCATREGNNFHSEQSLIQIRGISSILVIMSKKRDSLNTYGKIFRKGQVPVIKKLENRPSCGTTVTVYLSTKSSQWNDKIDAFTIRYIIGYLAIVNTQVSFSVRDDTSQSIVLRIGKNQKRRKLLSILCERRLAKGQVSRMKGLIVDEINIELYWGTECTSNKIHQIFLNLRPVNYPVLQNLAEKIIRNMCHKKVDICWDDIFFLFYIQSPESEYKFLWKDDKSIVEFHKIDKMVRSIKKIFTKRDLTNEGTNPIYQSLFFRPTGRITRAKKKRSFFEKFPRRYFAHKENVKEIKFKKNFTWKKQISKFVKKEERVCKPAEYGSEIKDNNDATITVPQTKESNLKSNSIEKNISSSTQTSVEKSKRNLNESSPIFHDVNENNICFNHNHNVLENSYALPANEQCIEKAKKETNENPSILRQESEDKNVLISQTKNRGVNLTELDKNINKHDISWISQKCIEHKKNQSALQQKIEDENVLISQTKNRGVNLTELDKNINNHDISWISQKCIEHKENLSDLRQKIEDENVLISQTKNRGPNLTVPNKKYKNHDISWISHRCAKQSQKNVRTSEMQIEGTPVRTQSNFSIDNLSVWSNWSYHSIIKNEKTIANKPIVYQRFTFLPVHLHALLPHGKVKLTDRDPIESFQTPPNFYRNLRRQDHEVRACMKHTFEFRLKLESLKSMKILNQVNREFIVALTKQDDKKLLVIIDQHAMHERIRYENFLKAYKGKSKNQQFVSSVLQRPIIISDFPSRDCKLLFINRELLIQFGLELSQRNENTLLIHAVPRCFLKKSFDCDNTRLEISVRKLLREVVGDLENGRLKILPFTINDAIASEACRGSIKFGDPLTKEQCDVLVSCWKDTNAPNRCAHGRPSVIPLLELSRYEGNENRLKPKVKLNFASLVKPREYIGPMGN